MPPWRVLLWLKATEIVLQARPKAIYRTFLQPDRSLRHAMQWYSRMGKRVWPYEIAGFLRDRLVRNGPTVEDFWGSAQDAEEYAMTAIPRPAGASIKPAQAARSAPRLEQ